MIKIAYPKALLYLLCFDIGLHLLEIAIDLHQYLGIFGGVLLWAGIV